MQGLADEEGPTPGPGQQIMPLAGQPPLEEPAPRVRELFKRRWSDASQWPELSVPGEEDSVEVPVEWDLVMDTNVTIRRLIVNGRLSFQNFG